MSWRNPDAEHGHWDLDTYAEAVLEARAATAEIARARAVHLTAACSGGIITAGALAHLARRATSASLTLLVCALDNARAGTAAALAGREVAAAAVAESARKGYLDGRALAGVFAWLRPNDLIWSYVVNNYLLGRKPPAFDVLYWNQDTVRLAAGLHRDFVRIALDNPLTRAGALEVLGAPVDLGAVTVDAYVVAGPQRPHRAVGERVSQRAAARRRDALRAVDERPHPGARRTRRAPRAARATATAAERPAEPDEWVDAAATHRGSWWPDWTAWLGRALRRAQARAGEARQPQAQGARARRRGAMSTPPEPRGGAARSPSRAGRSSSPACPSTRRLRGAASHAATGGRWCSCPGFLAGDPTLLVLAAWLRRIGHRPYTCGFLANVDCSDRALDRVERRVEQLHRRHGRRVALVGHSRGGHFARALAHRRPDRVSHAVSLGADLQRMFGISAPTQAAVGAARRGVAALRPRPRRALPDRGMHVRVRARLRRSRPVRPRAA